MKKNLLLGWLVLSSSGLLAPVALLAVLAMGSVFGKFSVTGKHISQSHAEQGCSMFPLNHLTYPVNTGSRYMSMPLFDQILSRVEAVYRPYFQKAGHRFVIERRWFDPTVNAYATNEGPTRSIHMFGGLARHPMLTPDAFASVACHEIGHHLGGAPMKSVEWASSEGESDYYATLKCMRLYFQGQNNDFAVSHMIIDADANRFCNKAYNTREDVNICLRSLMAGKSLARVLSTLSEDPKLPEITTPDSTVVTQTYVEHPAAQCRLDTYLAGALCRADVLEPMGYQNIWQGSCDGVRQYTFGQRPRCWFNPQDPRVVPN